MQDILLEIVGWVANVLFSICALPEAIHTFKKKIQPPMLWSFFFIWFFAVIFSTFYLVLRDIKDNIVHWPAYGGYVISFSILSFLMYAKKYYTNVR